MYIFSDTDVIFYSNRRVFNVHVIIIYDLDGSLPLECVQVVVQPDQLTLRVPLHLLFILHLALLSRLVNTL
jgi:hypothetical protein